MTIFERLTLVEKQADDFGFMWENPFQILDQVQSECQEIQNDLTQNGDQNHLQEEIGDLLHAAFSLCLFCNFDAEETLVKSINKFERRFQVLKKLAHEAGYDTLQGQPVEVLMAFWGKAKKRVA